MDPVNLNEHDPTMDANLVHAVNVNNKKGEAEMKFLTKSLANARHVQENIYRQEEKDLIRQLWKLHREKERRHPEIDHTRRSGHEMRRLSSNQLDESHSRRGSFGLINDRPRHPVPAHHHTAGEMFHLADASQNDLGFAKREPHDITHHGVSHYHVPYAGTSSHHFSPAMLVSHRVPECYPQPLSHHHRHAARGYQPPEDIPGVALQSSTLNVVVQPAGYGHSIAEHAAHLGMRKPYHRGMPIGHHERHAQPSHQLTDGAHNLGSYEDMTRYITLLDYQANEEEKSSKHPKKQPRAHKKGSDARRQDSEVISQSKAVGGTEENGAHAKTALSPSTKSRGSGKSDHDTNGTDNHQKPPDDEAHGGEKTQSESVEKVSQRTESADRHPVTLKETSATKKGNRRGTKTSTHEMVVQDSHGELLPKRSSQHPRSQISWHPSSYSTVQHPQPSYYVHAVVRQIPDRHHHDSYSHHHHQTAGESTHHHHPPRQHHHHLHHPAPATTAAERKRLAIELLAREYPVLLRNAPTKFDPLDALMCRYLRLSSSNVESLEAMCKEAGVEVGAHAHHKIDDPNEYVFGSEKSND